MRSSDLVVGTQLPYRKTRHSHPRRLVSQRAAKHRRHAFVPAHRLAAASAVTLRHRTLTAHQRRPQDDPRRYRLDPQARDAFRIVTLGESPVIVYTSPPHDEMQTAAVAQSIPCRDRRSRSCGPDPGKRRSQPLRQSSGFASASGDRYRCSFVQRLLNRTPRYCQRSLLFAQTGTRR